MFHGKVDEDYREGRHISICIYRYIHIYAYIYFFCLNLETKTSSEGPVMISREFKKESQVSPKDAALFILPGLSADGGRE